MISEYMCKDMCAKLDKDNLLSFLPKCLCDIVNEYKYQIEHTERFNDTLEEIKKIKIVRIRQDNYNLQVIICKISLEDAIEFAHGRKYLDQIITRIYASFMLLYDDNNKNTDIYSFHNFKPCKT